jgi:FkbM family methyltransferase
VHPDRTPSQPFETEFFGLSYRGDLSEFVDWSLFFYGAYEKEQLQLLVDRARRSPGAVFLDVGANVGHYSLAMSRCCRRVIAFDPFSTALARLRANAVRNEIGNIEVHELALGEMDERRTFFAPTGANKGTGSLLDSHARGNNTSKIVVRVVNGDRYVESHLALDRLDFVKIDVEGFERSVLRGLAHTLARFRPTILTEVSETTRSTFARGESLASFLPGYRIRRLAEGRRGHALLVPFSPKQPIGNFLCEPE